MPDLPALRVIHCDGSPSAVQELRVALRAALAGGATLAPLAPGQTPPPWDPGPGQVVVATSGSTAPSDSTASSGSTGGAAGDPKWVLLSADALRAAAAATQARLGGPGRWLLALPTHHIAGLQVLVRAALAGTDPAVLDLRGGFDPAGFAAAANQLAAVNRPAGRCYTALVPTQLTRLLDTCPGALTGFDAVLLGGAAASDDLVRRAQTAGVRVVRTYGMTETAGGCVYDGWPLDGVRVRVASDGRIQLAGPMLATGYLDTPPQRQDAFRDGWFVTSDLGRLDGRGRLEVLGRADDMIVTGGVKVAPGEVEAVLTSLPGIAAACVVGLPDPEWGQRVSAVVVPTDRTHPPEPAALRAAARRLLTGAQTPKDIVLLDALPLHGIGKPDRNAIRALLATRSLTREWQHEF